MNNPQTPQPVQAIRPLIDWLDNYQQDSESNRELFSFFHDYDLSKSSTMRLKARGYFLKIYSLDFLQELFQRFSGSSFLFLGKGANSILSPERKDKIYLRLLLDKDQSLSKQELSEFRDFYDLPASISLSQLVVHAKTYGLDKWDGLTGIPGTLGGALAMNAGTKLGEISDIVSEVQVLRSCGKLEVVQTNQNSFSYRKNHFLREGDLIISARLKTFTRSVNLREEIKNYLDYRTRTQPLWEKTCGSVFKNHTQYLAGKTIDITCLKGLRSGGLGVSQKHANFIVNNLDGNQSDFLRLTDALKQELELIYGVSFELEARFL